MTTITDKQKIFCKEYLVDFNATRAALAAGYAKKSAVHSGSRNLANPVIQEYIRAEKEKLVKKIDVKVDDVLQELARIAFVDPSEIMRKKTKRVKGLGVARIEITDTDKLSEDARHCIEELGENSTGGIKCKLSSKTKALELLGRYLGMWVERREISGPDGGPVEHRVERLTDEELERIAAGDEDN